MSPIHYLNELIYLYLHLHIIHFLFIIYLHLHIFPFLSVYLNAFCDSQNSFRLHTDRFYFL